MKACSKSAISFGMSADFAASQCNTQLLLLQLHYAGCSRKRPNRERRGDIPPLKSCDNGQQKQNGEKRPSGSYEKSSAVATESTQEENETATRGERKTQTSATLLRFSLSTRSRRGQFYLDLRDA